MRSVSSELKELINDYFERPALKPLSFGALNCDEICLRIEKSKVYLKDVQIGISKNVKDMILPFSVPLSESYLISSEVFAQCLIPENSSNSPSMLTHQLTSLTLGIAMKFRTSWEERSGKYKPDLKVKLPMTEESILIDVTGENTYKKLSMMPKRDFIISVNKYRVLELVCDSEFIKGLIYFSKKNESIDTSVALDMVNNQMRNRPKELLYSKVTLDLFRDIESESFLRLKSCANEAFDEYSESLIEDSKERDIFEEEEDSEKNRNMNELIYKELKEILNDLNRENPLVYDSDHFQFPKLTKINVSYYTQREREQLGKDRPDILYTEKKVIDGFYDYGDDDEELDRRLYDSESSMIVETKTYISILNYPNDKNKKRDDLKSYFDLMFREFGYLTTVWKKALQDRIFEKLGIRFDGVSKRNRVAKGFIEMERTKTPFDRERFSMNELRIEIDPDHLSYIKKFNCELLQPFLWYSRDYHILRFKARISQAICYNRKPDKCFRVNHWLFNNLYALVKIKGLIFEKDKGVVYVTYVHDQRVYRTEKWRLSDVENFSIGHHRLICLLVSAQMSIKESLSSQQKILYARILSENSWGLSLFLKAYRYFSSGICMKSDSIIGSLKKMIKEINRSTRRKLSFRALLATLVSKSKDGKITLGKTPLFDLKFVNIGWETFLMNLCPSDTYGKYRHLSNTITELANEIDLFDLNFNLIKDLYRSFDEIVLKAKTHNYVEIKQMFIEHIRQINTLSEDTSERFTFSPFSLLLVADMIPKSLSYSSTQGSVPSLSDLMTAKGSTNSFNYKPCPAFDSMTDLAIKSNSTSTSLIGINLLLNLLKNNRPIDLTMRMFDKDQIGGDREISIMSNEMRILQVIAEKFSVKVAQLTGVDKLNDKKKIKEYIDIYEKSINSEYRLYLTADQSRWGPNFNTTIFGLINLMICSFTTEAYIPFLICMISEFKVFEMPCWVPDLFNRSNYRYTISGKLGRNHMGQGIFHQSSSLYHSLVILRLRKFLMGPLESLKERGLFKFVDLSVESLVTSDDLVMLIYFYGDINSLTLSDRKRLSLMLNTMNQYLKKIRFVFVLFGIKTSDYKNILSRYCAEFNSIFLSSEGFGSTDIKFCYSLLDPSTTGNFLNDFNYVYDSYVNARNSLCSHGSSVAISSMNMIKFCRQWKISSKLVSYPKDDWLIRGLPKIYDIKEKDEYQETNLSTPSNLRFKFRNLLERHINTGNVFLDNLIRGSLYRIKGTRERTPNRSILTFSTQDKIRLDSPFFQMFHLLGETYRAFIKEMNNDIDHLRLILNPDFQTTFECYPEEYKSSRGHYKLLKLRESLNVEVKLFELIVSHYPEQKYLSRDLDKIQLHMMRKYNKLKILNKVFDEQKVKLSEAISLCDEKIRDYELLTTACNSYIFDESDQPINYTRYVYYPPDSIKIIQKRVSIKYCVNLERLSSMKRYFSSSKIFIERLVFENQKPDIQSETIGNIVRQVDIKEVEIDEITTDDLLDLEIRPLLESELKYRESSLESVFINIEIERSRISGFLTSQDIKSIESTNDEMEFLMSLDEINLGLELEEITESKELANAGKGINDETDDEESRRLAKHFEESMTRRDITELTVVSFELRRCLGFLTNKSWTIKTLIFQALVNKLCRENILWKPGPGEFSIFSNNHPSSNNLIDLPRRIYTFDPQIIQKLRTISYSSESSIKSKNTYYNKEIQNYLIKEAAKNSIENKDLMKLLLMENPKISYTSLPQGTLVENLNEFFKIVDKMFD